MLLASFVHSRMFGKSNKLRWKAASLLTLLCYLVEPEDIYALHNIIITGHADMKCGVSLGRVRARILGPRQELRPALNAKDKNIFILLVLSWHKGDARTWL